MRVLVAGGGTGGHVVPAIAVSAELKRRGAEILFVGDSKPDLRRLVEAAGFRFVDIPAGKFRRYFSLQTVLEPFRSYAGYRKAQDIIREFKPDVVFAKGGYVSVPVMRAAKKLKVPIVLHESDVVPGMANKTGSRWASAVAVSFPPEQMPWTPPKPLTHTGNPIRSGVTKGSAAAAVKRFGLEANLPTIFVMGGSQGARAINAVVLDALPELLPEAQVVHQTGRGKGAEATGVPDRLINRYHPVEFLDEELFDVYDTADLIISRASAGGLADIAAVGTPSILIPLSTAASDHQAANAEVFATAGAALALPEDDLTSAELARAVKRLLHDPTRRSRMARAAKTLAHPDAAKKVADLVWQTGERRG